MLDARVWGPLREIVSASESESESESGRGKERVGGGQVRERCSTEGFDRGFGWLRHVVAIGFRA